MAALNPLYQGLEETLDQALGAHLPPTCRDRLGLLVAGIIASRSCLVFRMARELAAMGLSGATAESIERRLRHSLGDPFLEAEVVYPPLLEQIVDWPQLSRAGRYLVIAIDESSKEDEIHLLRASLTYQGRAVPLAWVIWEQNTPLSKGEYWKKMDQVLARVKKVLPSGIDVVVVADRAYDVPAFVDRVAKYHWHWVVRAKANGSLCFLDHCGRKHHLRSLLRRKVSRPGRRWKARGRVFQNAGWRDASVVAMWDQREADLLAVITDLPARWEVLGLFDRRFWIEPAFRDDKSSGWQWEDCQVKGLVHHQKLLLAMAVAALVTLALGVQEAQARIARLSIRAVKPRRAKESLFTLGLARARRLLYRAITTIGQLRLVPLGPGSWLQTLYAQQALHYYFPNCTVRP